MIVDRYANLKFKGCDESREQCLEQSENQNLEALA